MRITVTLDDELVEKTMQQSGLTKRSQAINAALKDYVKRSAQVRLAQLAGSYRGLDLSAPPRRSFDD